MDEATVAPFSTKLSVNPNPETQLLQNETRPTMWKKLYLQVTCQTIHDYFSKGGRESSEIKNEKEKGDLREWIIMEVG